MKGFSKQDFEVIEPLQRDELCRQLAAVLSSRLEAATNFEDEIASIIDDLRKVGHDLWSFDEDIGHQFWGRNYAKPSPPGLLIEFRAPHDVVVMWDTK